MASRKEQKEKLRQERMAREAEAAAAAARKRRLGYVIGGVMVAAVVVAVVVVVAVGGGGSSSSASGGGSWPSGSVPSRKVTDLDQAVKAAGCTFKSPKDEGRGHTLKIQNYKSQPPTSGAHNPTPAHDQAYITNPGEEHLVHGLEHGRVIYWFKPNAPAKVRGDLKALYDENKALVILTPNTRPMPYQVAASAWGHLVGCPTYNNKVPDAFRAFRDAYRLKGPEYFPNAE